MCQVFLCDFWQKWIIAYSHVSLTRATDKARCGWYFSCFLWYMSGKVPFLCEFSETCTYRDHFLQFFFGGSPDFQRIVHNSSVWDCFAPHAYRQKMWHFGTSVNFQNTCCCFQEGLSSPFSVVVVTSTRCVHGAAHLKSSRSVWPLHISSRIIIYSDRCQLGPLPTRIHQKGLAKDERKIKPRFTTWSNFFFGGGGLSLANPFCEYGPQANSDKWVRLKYGIYPTPNEFNIFCSMYTVKPYRTVWTR